MWSRKTNEIKLPSREAVGLKIYLSWRASSSKRLLTEWNCRSLTLLDDSHIQHLSHNLRRHRWVTWAACAHKNHCLRAGSVLSGLSLREQLTLFTKAYFYPSHTNTTNKERKPQSIEWGDRFTASQGQGSSGWMLSWSALFSLYSFLSLRCPLGSHPSPSIPLFCLFYINTIRPGRSPHWYTFSLSLGLPFTRRHVRKHTHTARTHVYKERCWLNVVNGLLWWTTQIYTHILTHWDSSSTPGGKVWDYKINLLLIWFVWSMGRTMGT